MVDLVLVQADGAHEVDLDLVAGEDAAQERGAVRSRVLGDGEDRRDVVAGVRVVGGEEGVVVVELAHGHTVGPRGPVRADSLGLLEAEDGGTGAVGVGFRLTARGDDGRAAEARDGDGGVVDDAVDDHVDGGLVEGSGGVGGKVGEAAGELLARGQVLAALVGADLVGLHGVS